MGDVVSIISRTRGSYCLGSVIWKVEYDGGSSWGPKESSHLEKWACFFFWPALHSCHEVFRAVRSTLFDAARSLGQHTAFCHQGDQGRQGFLPNLGSRELDSVK